MDQPPQIRVSPPGPRSRELGLRLGRVENPAFAERRASRAAADGSGDPDAPIVLARGAGANLYDVDDNRFVDLAAGFGAAVLGHGPSRAHQAAAAQLGTLVQGLGDLYASEPKVLLLERLTRLLPGHGTRAMLCQSGADAVTAALKTAVLATGRPGVIAFEGAYHGLSYAPLAACGLAPSFREPFSAQLGAHVTFVPYPAPGVSERALDRVRARLATGDVGAVLFEPILGRGGVVVPPAGFAATLAAACRSAGALLVADEIWTGMGRAGSLVATVAAGAAPDLLVLGKGLGASFPISACVGTAEAMAGWARGGTVLHTSTHAGAPLACAAALATLDEIAASDLAARARDLGDRAKAALAAALRSVSGVVEVRGAGLLLGVELASGARGLGALRALLRRGYVATAGGRAGEVLVLTPPLTIGEDVLLGAVEAIEASIREAA